MADNIKTVFRLLKLYAKMDLSWLLQDWTNAVIVILSETLQNLSGMAGILLLAVRFGGVGGMTADEALAAAEKVGYPVLLRPSYVLGGQNMIIAFSDADIREYIDERYIDEHCVARGKIRYSDGDFRKQSSTSLREV